MWEGAGQATRLLYESIWGRCVSGRGAILPVTSPWIVKIIINYQFEVEKLHSVELNRILNDEIANTNGVPLRDADLYMLADVFPLFHSTLVSGCDRCGAVAWRGRTAAAAEKLFFWQWLRKTHPAKKVN